LSLENGAFTKMYERRKEFQAQVLFDELIEIVD